VGGVGWGGGADPGGIVVDLEVGVSQEVILRSPMWVGGFLPR
jgi:hypothetical protein